MIRLFFISCDVVALSGVSSTPSNLFFLARVALISSEAPGPYQSRNDAKQLVGSSLANFFICHYWFHLLVVFDTQPSGISPDIDCTFYIDIFLLYNPRLQNI